MAKTAVKESKSEILIEAAKGSRRFDNIIDLVSGKSVSEIKGYNQVAKIDGLDYSENLGSYPKQKFPGTHQGNKVRFSIEANRFIMKDADGNLLTQKQIDEYVKKIPLRYPDWYKIKDKRGERITESDITDSGDAFLCNPELYINLFEGDNLDDTLSPNTPKGELKLAIARGINTFMTETTDMIASSEIEYFIREPEVAEKRVTSVREKKELAYGFYNGMKTDPERMRKIINLYNIDIDESASTESMRNILYAKLEDNVNMTNGNSMQELFCYFSELEKPDLDLMSTISLACLRRIILDRAGEYYYGDVHLSSTYDGMINELRKNENSHYLKSIQLKLEKGND